MSSYYRRGAQPKDADVTRGMASCASERPLCEAAASYTKLLQQAPLICRRKSSCLGKTSSWSATLWRSATTSRSAIRWHGGSLLPAQSTPKSNKVDRAVEQFREVVRLDKENYKGVYCNMANAYYEANRYESAIKAAREGLAADSTSACRTSAGAGPGQAGPPQEQFQCSSSPRRSTFARLRRRSWSGNAASCAAPDEVEPTARPTGGNPDEEETRWFGRRFDARCSVRP